MLYERSTPLNVTRRKVAGLGAAIVFGAGLALLLLAALGAAGEPAALAAPLASPGLAALTPAQDYNDRATVTSTRAYLPMMAAICGDFFDDFSSPASGWHVGDDGWVWASYFNGEYRLLSKVAGYVYDFTAPACRSENYTVEADARWADASGDDYGLEFGISGNDQYYFFAVGADYGDFALFRRDAGAWVTLAHWTLSEAVHRGGASNHLKATRNGPQIRLDLNGVYLGTWTDDAITGTTQVGLFSSPHANVPGSDARFDNYRVTILPGATGWGVAAQGGLGAMGEGTAPVTNRDVAPPRRASGP